MKVQEVILENNMKRYLLLDDRGAPIPQVMKYNGLIWSHKNAVNPAMKRAGYKI